MAGAPSRLAASVSSTGRRCCDPPRNVVKASVLGALAILRTRTRWSLHTTPPHGPASMPHAVVGIRSVGALPRHAGRCVDMVPTAVDAPTTWILAALSLRTAGRLRRAEARTCCAVQVRSRLRGAAPCFVARASRRPVALGVALREGRAASPGDARLRVALSYGRAACCVPALSRAAA